MRKVLVVILILVLAFLGYGFFQTGPEIRNAAPMGETIIAFGDSLTRGTGASPEMDYPSQLSRMIRAPIINAGTPGLTTARALERLDDDVLTNSPRIVLITLGGNDLKNGVARETAFANLRQIVTAIQDSGALVILGGIDVPLYGRGFGPAYEQLAEETGSVLIENIYKSIWGRPDLMADPIHPNDAGYRIMAERFAEALEPYL